MTPVVDELHPEPTPVIAELLLAHLAADRRQDVQVPGDLLSGQARFLDHVLVVPGQHPRQALVPAREASPTRPSDLAPGLMSASRSATALPAISVRLRMTAVEFLPPTTKPDLGSSRGAC